MSYKLDTASDIGSQFGQTFTRLFSVVTVIGGLGLFSQSVDKNPAILVVILGIHGIFTNYSRVGIIRKFLAYLSGAAGGVILVDVLRQII